jgi:hypothetical protein
VATFRELADSAIPTSLPGQDAIQRKILLRGRMIFVEEHLNGHHRKLAVIEWTIESLSYTWWKIPVSDTASTFNSRWLMRSFQSMYTSWQPVGGYILCSGPRGICVVPLSCLQGPLSEQLDGICSMGVRFWNYADAPVLITFDESSLTSVRSFEETVVKVSGVALDIMSTLHLFDLFIRVYDDGRLQVGVIVSDQVSEQPCLERLVYSQGMLWGTDEWLLYVSPMKGRNGMKGMMIELGAVEAVDPCAGLVCTGTFEAGVNESEVLSCLSVLSYTPA